MNPYKELLRETLKGVSPDPLGIVERKFDIVFTDTAEEAINHIVADGIEEMLSGCGIGMETPSRVRLDCNYIRQHIKNLRK